MSKLIEPEKHYCFYFPDVEKYSIIGEYHAKEMKRRFDREGMNYEMKCIQPELSKLFQKPPYSPERAKIDQLMDEFYDIEKRLKALEKEARSK